MLRMSFAIGPLDVALAQRIREVVRLGAAALGSRAAAVSVLPFASHGHFSDWKAVTRAGIFKAPKGLRCSNPIAFQ